MKQLGPILKTLFVLYFLLGGIEVHTQELRAKHLKTLSSLGVEHQDLDLTREKINTDFQNIVTLEKRRKGQKTAGSILLPLGVVFACLSVSMIATNKKGYRTEDDEPYDPKRRENAGLSLKSTIGTSLFVLGAAQIGVSICFLNIG